MAKKANARLFFVRILIRVFVLDNTSLVKSAARVQVSHIFSLHHSAIRTVAKQEKQLKSL